MRKYRQGQFGAASRFGRRRRAAPGAVSGTPGYITIGGQPVYQEESPLLRNHRDRWRIFENIIANTAPVSAGVRFFGDLIMGSDWTFTPSEADGTGEYAERCARMLTEDPVTPWAHIVARIGMYKYYGFSIHEWYMRADDEGYMTFDDISPRPGASIYAWDVDERGKVRGVVQQDPQTSRYNYMHTNKLVYVVDDVHQATPWGYGLLRQLVEPSRRLERYEQLEGWGYDLDMRGVPIIRTPREEMEDEAERERGKEDPSITLDDIDAMEYELRELANDHSFNPERGIILDSAVYRSTENDMRPGNTYKWAVDLMQGDARSHAEIAAAIERLKHECMQIQSMDNLLTGADGTGSYALSKDKTQSCFLMINAVMGTIRSVVDKSLVAPLWSLNGWDEDLRPDVEVSIVDHKDIFALATAYRDVGMASAALPEAAIQAWFAMAGIEIEEDDWAVIDDGGEEGVDIDEPMEEGPEGNGGMDKAVVVRPQTPVLDRRTYFPKAGVVRVRKRRAA